jgi:hypothetical protein
VIRPGCWGLLLLLATATVHAKPPHQTAYLSFAADRHEYQTGDTALLSWSSVNARFCQASGDWSGKMATEGVFRTPPLDGSKSYNLKCNSQGGGVERTVQVTVTAPASTEPTPTPTPTPAPTPTLAFTASDTAIANGSSTTLSWYSENATDCSASGGWSGARNASGSESVGPIHAGSTYSLTCTGPGGSVVEMLRVSVMSAISISWVAPSENVDGTTLTDLSGYRIYFGTGSRSYSDVVEVMDPTATSHALDLTSGDYHIAMTALDSDGNESAYSNEIRRSAP